VKATINKKYSYLFPVLLPFLPKGEKKIGGIKKMKEVNKGILDNDIVISVENIQKIGEVIALTCIKTVIVHGGKICIIFIKDC
jgi:hypothetical protein